MQEISAALDDADEGDDEERHDLHHGVQYSTVQYSNVQYRDHFGVSHLVLAQIYRLSQKMGQKRDSHMLHDWHCHQWLPG